MRQWIHYLFFICLVSIATIAGYRYVHADWVSFRQAETLFSEKNYLQAVPLYERGIRNGLSRHDAYKHLAECYENTGRSAEVIALYELLSQKNPGDFWLHLELGDLYGRHNRFDSAMKAYRHALSIRPDSRLGRFYLARCLTAFGQFDDAIREYRILLGEYHESE